VHGKEGHSHPTADGEHGNAEALHKDDLKHANGAAHKTPPRKTESPEEANHYRIAANMLNFQSLDLGDKCMSPHLMPRLKHGH
jgi:hypothetical protein